MALHFVFKGRKGVSNSLGVCFNFVVSSSSRALTHSEAAAVAIQRQSPSVALHAFVCIESWGGRWSIVYNATKRNVPVTPRAIRLFSSFVLGGRGRDWRRLPHPYKFRCSKRRLLSLRRNLDLQTLASLQPPGFDLRSDPDLRPPVVVLRFPPPPLPSQRLTCSVSWKFQNFSNLIGAVVHQLFHQSDCNNLSL